MSSVELAQSSPEELTWASAYVISAITSLVLLASGIFLRAIARRAADGRLGRNRLAGMRSTATLASDDAWIAGQVASEPHSLRAADCMTVGAVGSVGVGSLLGSIGVVGPVGYLVVWTALILTSTVAVGIFSVLAFRAGNRAAKLSTELAAESPPPS